MLWYMPVLLRIIIAHGLFPSFVKVLGRRSLAKRNVLQFLFCFSYAVCFALLWGQLIIDQRIYPIVIMGLFNGVGAYCQWQAIRISLSRNALFTFWDDIIAMLLAYVILGEGQFLNAGIGIGIALSLGAVILFAVEQYQKEKEQGKGSLAFYFYVGVYSLVWGVATFFMRFMGLQHYSAGAFLPPWYLGSLITALLIMVYRQGSDKENFLSSKRELLVMGVFSTLVIGALALEYYAFLLAPLIIVQPIFLVSEMVVPSLIGLYVFRERKDLNRKQKMFFALCILGGLLIVLSF